MSVTLFSRVQSHRSYEANLASRTLATSLGGEGRILYHNFDKALT